MISITNTKAIMDLVIKNGESYYRLNNQHYYHNGGHLRDEEERKAEFDEKPDQIVVSVPNLLKQNFQSEPILLEMIHKSIRPCKKIWVIYANNGHNSFNENGQYLVNLHILPGQDIPHPLLEYRIVAYNYIMIPQTPTTDDIPISLTRLPTSHYPNIFISHLETILDRSMYHEFGYQPLENLQHEISFRVVDWIPDV